MRREPQPWTVVEAGRLIVMLRDGRSNAELREAFPRHPWASINTKAHRLRQAGLVPARKRGGGKYEHLRHCVRPKTDGGSKSHYARIGVPAPLIDDYKALRRKLPMADALAILREQAARSAHV